MTGRAQTVRSSSESPRRWAEAPSPTRPRRAAVSAAAAALLALVTGLALLDAAEPGPLTRMMGLHVLLMNAVAPFLALALAGSGERFTGRLGAGASLTTATLLQVGAIGIMHVPGMLRSASADPRIHFLMQAMLLGAALWFWLAVLENRGARRWRSLLALAVTAKLFCLLAALLVFAPRVLAFGLASSHDGHGGGASLADQQLAGLVMLAACPLTYVLAGIIIAAQWLDELAHASLDRRHDRSGAMRAA